MRSRYEQEQRDRSLWPTPREEHNRREADANRREQGDRERKNKESDMDGRNDWYATSQDEAIALATLATERTTEPWAATDCSFGFTERWAIKRTTDGRCLSVGEAKQLKERSN